MRTIWKFPLKVTDRQFVNMPLNAEILTVQNQNGAACLWALVDPEQQIVEARAFEVIGTGNPIGDGRRRYIGTFQQPPLVWHVFEREVQE